MSPASCAYVAAVAMPLLAQLRGSISISERTEARLRSNLPSGAARDFDTQPIGVLRVESHRVFVGIAYSPHLVFSSLDPKRLFLNQGVLTTDWRASHQVAVSLGQTISYGEQSFGALTLPSQEPTAVPLRPDQPPAAVQRLPSVNSINTIGSRTFATVSYVPARRIAYRLSASYGANGGVSAADQTYYPLQYGLGGSANMTYVAGRRDHTTTTLGVDKIMFLPSTALDLQHQNGVTYTTTTLSENWTHDLSSNAHATLRAGAAEVLTRPKGGPTDASPPYPDVSAALTWRFPTDRLEMSLGVGAAPIVDRISGSAQWRGQGNAGLLWTVSQAGATRAGQPRLVFRGQVAGIQTIDTVRGSGSSSGPVTFGLGELGAAYRPATPLLLEAGLRGAVERQTGVPASSQSPPQWVVFLAATVRADPIAL